MYTSAISSYIVLTIMCVLYTLHNIKIVRRHIFSFCHGSITRSNHFILWFWIIIITCIIKCNNNKIGVFIKNKYLLLNCCIYDHSLFYALILLSIRWLCEGALFRQNKVFVYRQFGFIAEETRMLCFEKLNFSCFFYAAEPVFKVKQCVWTCL